MNIGIFASDRDNLIGIDQNGVYRLPWGRLHADLEHFKATTMGNTLIAGRTTWDTLKSPLKGRRCLYLTTRKTSLTDYGKNLSQIERLLGNTGQDYYIIGGARTFSVLAGYIEKFIITKVECSHTLKDDETGVYFDIGNHWKITEETDIMTSKVSDNPKYTELEYKIQTFVKK